jgi:hypothetical protein
MWDLSINCLNNTGQWYAPSAFLISYENSIWEVDCFLNARKITSFTFCFLIQSVLIIWTTMCSKYKQNLLWFFGFFYHIMCSIHQNLSSTYKWNCGLVSFAVEYKIDEFIYKDLHFIFLMLSFSHFWQKFHCEEKIADFKFKVLSV